MPLNPDYEPTKLERLADAVQSEVHIHDTAAKIIVISVFLIILLAVLGTSAGVLAGYLLGVAVAVVARGR